jgi:lysine 6-dehydrogenase
MGQKVLVLGGCGAMGTEVTRDLVATATEFSEIAIADIDLGRAQKLAGELGRKCTAHKVDMNDEAGIAKLMSGYDVVANATTYHFGMNATRAAIAAKKSYLDLGGLYNTPKQLALDEEAKAAGCTILLGCGATPGVTNLMARYGASRMDSPRAVHIAFASFRDIAPSPGLLDTILDEFGPDTVRTYYEDGKFLEQPPFAGQKRVDFLAPVGPQDVYYVPHSETRTMPKFIEGVTRVDVRGCWQIEIMDRLKFFLSQGLLDTKPVAVAGSEVGPKAFLKAHILSRPGGEAALWAFFLNVEVVGTHKGRATRRVFRTSHPDMSAWGKGATAKMTGIPASIGAQMLAQGKAKVKGVVAPEACFVPEEFFRELEKRGIQVHETVHEEGYI